MINQQVLRQHLQVRLDGMKQKNPRFSLRAFAKQLQLHPSALSEFLNGKRNFSLQQSHLIAINIGMSAEQLGDIIPAGVSNKQRYPLPEDQYHLVADWTYYAILCLAETHDFQTDASWIAQRLNIKAEKAQHVLESLIRLGHLEYNPQGKLIPRASELVTTDGPTNQSLMARHQQNLQDAQYAIKAVPVEKRDYSFMTLAIDPHKLPRIKKLIRKLQDEIAELADQKMDKKEVYEFCFHVFPRSHHSDCFDR